MDHSCYFWCVFDRLSCASVYCCLVSTCWERADLLALVCDVLLCVCCFPIGILGQVWYLIVSIPDLCPLTYFVCLAIRVYILLVHVGSVGKNNQIERGKSFRGPSQISVITFNTTRYMTFYHELCLKCHTSNQKPFCHLQAIDN